MVRKLFAAPALAKYVAAETQPGNDVQSDDELLDYARQTGSTVFHATCTCKMGRTSMAVVDDRLRVRGLQRLRVIDASVMPAVTSTNTNAPTIMIAEKGAAMILDDARVRRQEKPQRSRTLRLPAAIAGVTPAAGRDGQ